MATPRALVLLAALVASAAQSAPFWLAADFSYEPIESKFGTSSPYRLTAGGPTMDAFVLLKQTGVNIIRLRLWVNPTTGFEGDESYCNLTSVLSVAKRVTAAGLAVWLDFHASDTWADPGKQAKPRAWANLAADALLAAWVDHVTTAVNALVAQGSAPAVVQGSQPCTDGGRIGGGCNNNWQSLVRFVDAGVKAVRKAAPAAQVMIHVDLGNHLGKGQSGVNDINNWFKSYTGAGGTDFDAIGLSCYVKWGCGNTSNLALLSGVKAAFPGKAVVIAETAYPWGGQETPGSEFPWTPAGQATFQRTMFQRAHDAGLGGVAWWGGEEFDQNTGAGQTALFDRSGVALPALTQGWK